jgi:hypothetical protein
LLVAAQALEGRYDGVRVLILGVSDEDVEGIAVDPARAIELVDRHLDAADHLLAVGRRISAERRQNADFDGFSGKRLADTRQ